MNNEINTLSDSPTARTHRSSIRRLSLDSQRWRAEGESFAGLPGGVTAAHQLLALVKAAAPAIRLTGTDQRLIDKLFQYTRPVDWTPPSRPIVSVSNEVLGEDLNLSRSAVQRALRRLQEHGLIVMKDSPTGQRYFRRHETTGAILPAKSFGVDLAILAVRYDELKALAERHAADKRARRDAKRRAIIAWRMVAQSLETAEEEGLWASFWESLEERAFSFRKLIPVVRNLTERTHVAESLERMAVEAREVLTSAFEIKAQEMKTRSADRASEAPKNDTEGSLDSESVSTRQNESWRAETLRLKEAEEETSKSERGPHITPQEIVTLVPELRAMAGPAPTWADLGEACEKIRADFEIGHRLWDRAHLALGGPQRRIVAFADMLTYPDQHFVKGRGAYFAGMVKLAEKGALNLGSSLYGMRKRGGEGRPLTASSRAVNKSLRAPSLAEVATRMVNHRQLDGEC